jgi:hypothetical protein
MPQNTRSQTGPSQPKIEKWHLLTFPCDETHGYFKANVCKTSQEDPRKVKLNYKGKLYEAIILFSGSKYEVKEEALRLHVEVSCSSDDEDAHNLVIAESLADDEFENENICYNDTFFSPPNKRESFAKLKNKTKTPVRFSEQQPKTPSSNCGSVFIYRQIIYRMNIYRMSIYRKFIYRSIFISTIDI